MRPIVVKEKVKGPIRNWAPAEGRWKLIPYDLYRPPRFLVLLWSSTRQVSFSFSGWSAEAGDWGENEWKANLVQRVVTIMSQNIKEIQWSKKPLEAIYNPRWRCIKTCYPPFRRQFLCHFSARFQIRWQTRRHPCKNFSALNNSEMQKEGSLLQTKSAK